MSETRDNTRAWYRAAVGTAVVAGIFSMAVAALLIANHVQTETVRDSELMRVGKIVLADDPENRALREEIRELDQSLRQRYIRRTRFNAPGGLLLLFGMVALLVAAKAAATLRKELPAPGAAVTEPRSLARAAVGAAGGMIAVGALLLIASAKTPLDPEILATGPVEEGATSQEDLGAPPPPAVADPSKEWTRFRGPTGNGVSPYTNLPKSWNGKSGEGILWKVPVPLSAPNSPVLWSDRIFFSGAKHKDLTVRCELYCFQADRGKLLWTHGLDLTAKDEDDLPEVMEATGYAAATVATDGERVYAIFATGKIVACTMNGKEVWVKDFGKLDNSYGHGSSLLTDGKHLIVLLDQAMPEDKKSRLYALDGPTGKIVWETVREAPQTWATPIIVDTGKRREVICCGDPWLTAYGAADGKELWRAELLGGEIAPSPVFADGYILIANSGAYAAAVRPGGSGNVTKTHVAWKMDEGLPDIASPLATPELGFLLTTDGLVTCVDMKDGKTVWEHEFELAFSASPSLVGDSLLITSEKGITIAVQASRQFKEVGRNDLGEPVRASMAFADGRIYMRGKKNLYCIGQK